MLKKVNKFLYLFKRDKNLQELTDKLLIKKLEEQLNHKEEVILKLQNKIKFYTEITKADKSFQESVNYFKKNNNEKKLLLYSSLESITSKIKQTKEGILLNEYKREKGIILSKIKTCNILDTLMKEKFVLSCVSSKITELNNKELLSEIEKARSFYNNLENYFITKN